MCVELCEEITAATWEGMKTKCRLIVEAVLL